jgi:hypothetical protein
MLVILALVLLELHQSVLIIINPQPVEMVGGKEVNIVILEMDQVVLIVLLIQAIFVLVILHLFVLQLVAII